jgi:valyl-tRNA synthetase
MRLLHPLMPFSTEELWSVMGYRVLSDAVMRAPWPEAVEPAALESMGVAESEVAYVEAKHDLIRNARTLRTDYQIPPGRAVRFAVRPATEADAARLRDDLASLSTLLRAEAIEVDAGFQPGAAMPSRLSQLGMVFISLEGIVAVDAEIARLQKVRDEKDLQLQGVNRQLENQKFLERAKPEAVARVREQKKRLLEELAKAEKSVELMAGLKA